MTASPTESHQTKGSAPSYGTFKLRLRADGTIIVPDLAEPLIPLLQSTGADPELWRQVPCAVCKPKLEVTRNIMIGITRNELVAMPTSLLWQLHSACSVRLSKAAVSRSNFLDEVSLLDLKLELATRMLSPCTLCERRCKVSRTNGETGFCGLSTGAQVAGYSMLYNEGPLLGAPTFSVFMRGCSLRCTFCYRPDELKAKGQAEMSEVDLAGILDRAAGSGARSWHFLGGNPDESIPAILQAISLTRQSVPIVWNSCLLLTSEALELLIGVVDIWVPDFKFGNDSCARRIGHIDPYMEVLTRNLLALRDQPWVVVRHMEMSGHKDCCTDYVTSFVRRMLPDSSLHTFPCFDSNTRKSVAVKGVLE